MTTPARSSGGAACPCSRRPEGVRHRMARPGCGRRDSAPGRRAAVPTRARRHRAGWAVPAAFHGRDGPVRNFATLLGYAGRKRPALAVRTGAASSRRDRRWPSCRWSPSLHRCDWRYVQTARRSPRSVWARPPTPRRHGRRVVPVRSAIRNPPARSRFPTSSRPGAARHPAPVGDGPVRAAWSLATPSRIQRAASAELNALLPAELTASPRWSSPTHDVRVLGGRDVID